MSDYNILKHEQATRQAISAARGANIMNVQSKLEKVGEHQAALNAALAAAVLELLADKSGEKI